jgi:hypothetical protein
MLSLLPLMLAAMMLFLLCYVLVMVKRCAKYFLEFSTLGVRRNAFFSGKAERWQQNQTLIILSAFSFRHSFILS